MKARRQFIQSLANSIGKAAALGGSWACQSTGPKSQTDLQSHAICEESLFSCGIASGDPAEHGISLWTRLEPGCFARSSEDLVCEIFRPYDPQNLDGNMNRIWSTVIARAEIKQNNDYCVQIRVDEPNILEPFRYYFYRFYMGEASSKVGRFKTLPSPNQEFQKDLKFAFLTCQDYTTGYLNAYHHLARQELDYVLHLGDFIYEYHIYPGHHTIRNMGARQPAMHANRSREPGEFLNNYAVTLEDYHFIYRTFRKEPSLQEAMRRHTFIITWDDHETHNDWHWDSENKCIQVDKHSIYQYYDDDQVLQSKNLNDPSLISLRRAMKSAAQKAWRDYIPFYQPEISGLNSEGLDGEGRLKIYRKFKFGKRAELFMTDGRSYRSQPGTATSTMLGPEQKQWLLKGMQESESVWKLWGNQTLFTPLRIAGKNVNPDAWGGFAKERGEISKVIKGVSIGSETLTMPHLETQFPSRIEGVVILTGDMHTAMACEVESGIFDNNVAAEFMTPSVSSPNILDTISRSGARNVWFGDHLVERVLAMMNSDQFFYFEGNSYGYAIIKVGETQVEYEHLEVDKNQANNHEFVEAQSRRSIRYERQSRKMFKSS